MDLLYISNSILPVYLGEYSGEKPRNSVGASGSWLWDSEQVADTGYDDAFQKSNVTEGCGHEQWKYDGLTRWLSR